MATDNPRSNAALFGVGALLVTVTIGALIATRSPNDIRESIDAQQAGVTEGADAAASSASSGLTDPADDSAPSTPDERCAELADLDPSGVSITFADGELALTIDGETIDLETLRDCLPDELGAMLDGQGLPNLDNLPGLGELPDFAEDFEMPEIPCPEGVSPNPDVPELEFPPELEELFGEDFDFAELFEMLPPLCTE